MQGHPWYGYQTEDLVRSFTARSLRMHSHNREYSVGTRLTCERTSFAKDLMDSYHLYPNVLEPGKIVK